MTNENANSRRQPLVAPEYVHIVCQTLPNFPALEPDVAILLSQDAEYHIRQLIHLAKKRMQHSKRFRLTVHDVYIADSRRDKQPSLGHFASTIPTYHQVESCPGLFVLEDRFISLFDVMKTPLPRPSPTPHLNRSGIISPSLAIANVPRHAHVPHSHIVRNIEKLLLSNQAPPLFFQQTLSFLCTSSSLPLQPIVRVLRDVVHAHASVHGNSAVLYDALRMTTAIISRPTFGVEFFEEAVIEIVLTCLLATSLGQGDVYALRELAAETLRMYLVHVADDYVRRKVNNTLVTTLTDSKATLGCLFGAVIGLGAMGRQEFEQSVIPRIPRLITALENLSSVAAKVDPSKSGHIITDIVFLCQAIERCMHLCGLVWWERDFINIGL